jgi:hypothetical protein
MALKVNQHVQQGQGILAAGKAQQYTVAITNHGVIGDSAACLSQKGFGWLDLVSHKEARYSAMIQMQALVMKKIFRRLSV